MYRYRITVEALTENAAMHQMSFEAANHDDIMAVVQRIDGKLALDEDATRAFAVGLKLFGETILQNRDNLLFQQIRPAFGDFMRSLKQQL
ncbi:MAG: DUF3861 domain-containing protein [Edaphobacter sp.]|uniref:DUF3861 domain-containing protein n=1 Tax=Edaphobacter sp. TaxID=1934404 RepID=UPI002394F83D|nr:DUF3861 domain-containing protein [Edaphobacter sp.]MDE1178291.1 DUF3861 domain-containing protein [Edaphobacter sp.]